MIIIPAIDLLNGSCVRLYKGDYNRVTSYNLSPEKMAALFEEQGVKRLHLVDLDGARGEGKTNRSLIQGIRQNFSGLIELGGGVRSKEDIESLLDLGIDRLILGTILVQNPSQVESWIKEYGSLFIGGIDALDGEVKVSGWESGSSIQDIDLAKKCAQMGMKNIIYTNIAKDGTLSGPDIQRTEQIATASGLALTLSGGVSSTADIESVSANPSTGIKGIITGKALYEGRIDLKECITKYQRENEEMDW